MTRFPDWPMRLDRYLKAKQHEPFAWGTHDCALFACGAIEAMTGVNPAAPFEGKYHSQRTALRAIAEFCAGTLADLAERVCQQHAMQEVPPSYAQRGDLLLLAAESGYCLGIVSIDGVNAYFAAPDGLKAVSARQCNRAWRVG